jgi:hypothetical protein
VTVPISYVSTDDQWQNAILALIANTTPDPKPLARLLRSPAPIPEGIRDALAELLSPGKPEYLHCRLVLEKDNKAFEKDIKFKLPSIAEFARLRGENLSAVEAARLSGTGARTLFRRLAWHRDWLRRFGTP